MFETNETLEAALLNNVRDALAEDIGRGDWTAQLVPADRRAAGRVTAKQAAVICGRPWLDACVKTLEVSGGVDLGSIRENRCRPHFQWQAHEGRVRGRSLTAHQRRTQR